MSPCGECNSRRDHRGELLLRGSRPPLSPPRVGWWRRWPDTPARGMPEGSLWHLALPPSIEAPTPCRCTTKVYTGFSRTKGDSQLAPLSFTGGWPQKDLCLCVSEWGIMCTSPHTCAHHTDRLCHWLTIMGLSVKSSRNICKHLPETCLSPCSPPLEPCAPYSTAAHKQGA